MTDLSKLDPIALNKLLELVGHARTMGTQRCPMATYRTNLAPQTIAEDVARPPCLCGGMDDRRGMPRFTAAVNTA